MNYKKLIYPLLCGAVCNAVLTGTALAQGSAADQKAGQYDDIIVTAERRAESVQKVPISVTAISAADIEARGIQTTQDIVLATPGLTMSQTRSGVTPYIRGVGSQSSTAEGAVALYLDGVYMASSKGAIMSLNNVERVEVLKGPQGTLFGRNATGGLIHVITRDPKFTPEVRASAGYGNFDTLTGSLYATTGLSDTIAMDLAFSLSRQGDGWGKNLVLGNDVNIRREWAVRSKLLFDLGDDTRLVVAGDYSGWRSDIGSTRTLLPGTVGAGGLLPLASIYDTAASVPGIGTPPDTYGKKPKSWQGGASAKLTHSFGENISLTSLTAYREAMSRTFLEGDLTGSIKQDVFFVEPTTSFQQDLILSGDSNRFHWTAGLNYYRSTTAFAPFAMRFAPNTFFDIIAKDYMKSHAVFGQGAYDLGQGTKLTLGLRYSTDKLHNKARQVMGGVVLSSTDASSRDRTHKSWNSLTWRAAIDHRLTDDVLVYASVSKGYKAGAFNLTTPPLPANRSPIGDAVDPETVYSYEIGLKGEFFDRQLRTNAAVFYADYRNVQLFSVAGGGTTTTFFNADKARIYGGELDISYVPRLPTGDLKISAGLTILDPKYGKFPNAPYYNPLPAGGNILVNCVTDPAGCDASGNQMVRAPKFASTLGFNYSVPVSSDLAAGIDLNWSHTSKFYFEVDNRLNQPAYDLVNGQISIGRQDGGWRVRVWGRNLTNQKYHVYQQAGTIGDTGSPGAPRTYGVTLDLKFGG